MFVGINDAQQLRLVFAELGAISIPISFPIPRGHKVFDENNNLLDESYDERLDKFLNEFECILRHWENKENVGPLINLKHHKKDMW
jgi:NAD(P)H-dependent FMN reductase